MTPTDHITNSTPPPPFPFVLNNEDYDLNHSLVSPNYYQASSSSSYSSSYHEFFFNSTTNQNQTGYYHRDEYYTPPHQPEVDNEGGLYDVEKKNKVGSGLKLTLWKREDKNENQNEKNPVKWMSSKIKASDQTILEKTTNNSTYIKLKLEDQKQQPSYPLETDYSSNNSNNNIPIRVCADCNTTKTPLWRSGPKGPKTLCNACGIRQRKARRAMAAAAAANGETLTTETSSSSMKKKVNKHLHKEKITKVNVTVPYKKRCKFGQSSSSNTEPKKLGNFEDFLINLTNNLALHQIFPQDEKEAAVLLMALSSGLVHG
ncbi:putative GATA transcription factor 22 [Nicotiana tomentosiformis]|uniref:putative GATA transcription factor 22 n=1 Tax=Nicotiana tomentosiformis TaxID=4098 RepID=UPI00051BA73D|nr:putative GATA transcription factor 22 [Nicotiana tomentosiformis]